jgi:hypothetical protein
MMGDGTGGGLIVWADGRTAPGWDLYAQKFDGSGAALWLLSGMPVATGAYFQGSHAVVGDGRGGAVVAFEDNRSLTDDDLYAQRIRSDGSLSVSTSIQYVDGWNLISIPRAVAISDVDSLFPGNISAFLFTGSGYVQTGTLLPGQGAWVRMPDAGLFDVDGPAVDSVGAEVSSGSSWVLIGSPASRLPVSSLVSEPPGAVLQGSIFSFDGSRYVRATEFLPGRAYWVFVTAPCTLRLQ